LLEKAWEEYSAVQDRLEYDDDDDDGGGGGDEDDDDDDERQQPELDREAVTETYCELRARIDRMISEDRLTRDVSSAELQKPRAMHENSNCLAPKVKWPTIEHPKFGGQITEFKHFYDTFNSLIINNLALGDVKNFTPCCLL
jgi:hypothetical protein